MAAPRGVPFIVEENDAKIGVCGVGLHDKGSVHVAMAPGLPHQRSAEVVEVFTCESSFFQHSVTFKVGIAVQNDPERFTFGVEVQCLYGLETSIIFTPLTRK